MQMLLDESEEFGVTPGFGFIAGAVKAIPNTTSDGNPHKIPHIGWSGLQPSNNDWDGSLLADLNPGEACYFVHSFAASPKHKSERLADCVYNGRTICAAVRKGNLYGVQFHPEKSGPVGLKILARFIAGDH
jgi:glutamine amidotransferase